MATLQFVPCSTVRLKLGFGVNRLFFIKVKIQFGGKNVVLETGQALESMEGELQIYKEDIENASSQWLKANSFVGIIDYADDPDGSLRE